MPWEDPPITPSDIEEDIAALYRGIKSATLSVGASDTQDTSGCDYVCDGIDDQVEINQAITALPAGGGLIHLLEGTYNVSGQITIDKDNVAILGTGANTVIRVRDGHNVDIYVIAAAGRTDLLIKDLRIDGNRANQAAGAMTGIRFDTTTNSKVADCWVEGMRGIGIYLLTASNYNIIQGNTCRDNNQGIYLNGSDYNIVEGNISQANVGLAASIALHDSSDNIISGNTSQGNTGGGFLLENVSDRNTVVGNTCQGNGTVGIFLDDSDANTIDGNTIQGNGNSGIYLAGSLNNSIVGNTSQGNDWHGIRLRTSGHNMIADNQVVNNGQAADVTYDGISLELGCDYNNIQSNTIRTTVAAPPPNRQAYGIDIFNAACDGNLVANNDLYQSGQTGNYNDAGTDTRGTSTGEISPTGSTLVVAASNSIDPVRADYVCDGVADQVEINAAITALGAIGGTVKLLEGTFTVDSGIVLASNVALVGQGAGTVITIPNGFDAGINIIAGTGIDHVLVKDLRIDGNIANQAAGAMYGIYFDTVTHSKVVDCWVEDVYGGSGIYMLDTCEYNCISGNSFRGNGTYGIRVDGSDYNVIEGNNIHENQQHGIYLGTVARDNIVSDNTIADNGQAADVTYDGIFLTGADFNNIHGNTIRTTTANRHRYGINVSDAGSADNMVKDNDLYNSGITALFNDVGTRTKLPELWVNSIFDDSDANVTLSNIGDHVSLAHLEGMWETHSRFNFRVPSDFHQLVRARVLVVSEGNGDMAWGASTDWGMCAIEAYNAGTGGFPGPQTTGLILNVIECLDINVTLDGITAGDHVGVDFNRNAGDAGDTVPTVHLLQFWMQYV